MLGKSHLLLVNGGTIYTSFRSILWHCQLLLVNTETNSPLFGQCWEISTPIGQCRYTLTSYWSMLRQTHLFLVNAGTISTPIGQCRYTLTFYWSMQGQSHLLLVKAGTISPPLGQRWVILISYWSRLGQSHLLLVNAGTISPLIGQCWYNLISFWSMLSHSKLLWSKTSKLSGDVWVVLTTHLVYSKAEGFTYSLKLSRNISV